MLKSIQRAVLRRNLFVVRVFSPIHKSCFLQLNPFSSAATLTPKPTTKFEDGNNFTVDYLIKKFGFSSEKAFSVSKLLNIESTEKPESVVTLLKKQGFTTEQIGVMVRKLPCLILCDPQKTLLPKIEFYRSSGISKAEMTNIFQNKPGFFKRSLKKQIIPTFNYVKSLFDSNGTSLGSLKRLPYILRCDFHSQLHPNVEILREIGVPCPKILNLLRYQPRAFMLRKERFKEVVGQLKEMGFDPTGFQFVRALHALRSMSRSTWEKKMAVYKKWGWSEDDIISAFMKNPYCMTKSEDKIMQVMDFLVNKMGFDSSHMLKRPDILSYSFEKRIKPRCAVYVILWEKGLMKRSDRSLPDFKCTERDFLKNIIHRYEEEAPGLLKLYQKELAVLRS